MNKYIPISTKKNVLLRQNNKCAASIKDYKCLLWMVREGYFDESGYQFDHIDEYCLTKDNSENNIQALCPNCHAVKTKRFRKNKNTFTTTEMDNGLCFMDIDNSSKKRKKE